MHTPLTGGGGWDPSDIPPPFIGDRSAKIFFFLLNFSVFLSEEEEKKLPPRERNIDAFISILSYSKLFNINISLYENSKLLKFSRLLKIISEILPTPF